MRATISRRQRRLILPIARRGWMPIPRRWRVWIRLALRSTVVRWKRWLMILPMRASSSLTESPPVSWGLASSLSKAAIKQAEANFNAVTQENVDIARAQEKHRNTLAANMVSQNKKVADGRKLAYINSDGADDTFVLSPTELQIHIDAAAAANTTLITELADAHIGRVGAFGTALIAAATDTNSANQTFDNAANLAAVNYQDARFAAYETASDTIGAQTDTYNVSEATERRDHLQLLSPIESAYASAKVNDQNTSDEGRATAKYDFYATLWADQAARYETWATAENTDDAEFQWLQVKAQADWLADVKDDLVTELTETGNAFETRIAEGETAKYAYQVDAANAEITWLNDVATAEGTFDTNSSGNNEILTDGMVGADNQHLSSITNADADLLSDGAIAHAAHLSRLADATKAYQLAIDAGQSEADAYDDLVAARADSVKLLGDAEADANRDWKVDVNSANTTLVLTMAGLLLTWTQNNHTYESQLESDTEAALRTHATNELNATVVRDGALASDASDWHVDEVTAEANFRSADWTARVSALSSLVVASGNAAWAQFAYDEALAEQSAWESSKGAYIQLGVDRGAAFVAYQNDVGADQQIRQGKINTANQTHHADRASADTTLFNHQATLNHGFMTDVLTPSTTYVLQAAEIERTREMDQATATKNLSIGELNGSSYDQDDYESELDQADSDELTDKRAAQQTYFVDHAGLIKTHNDTLAPKLETWVADTSLADVTWTNSVETAWYDFKIDEASAFKTYQDQVALDENLYRASETANRVSAYNTQFGGTTDARETLAVSVVSADNTFATTMNGAQLTRDQSEASATETDSQSEALATRNRNNDLATHASTRNNDLASAGKDRTLAVGNALNDLANAGLYKTIVPAMPSPGNLVMPNPGTLRGLNLFTGVGDSVSQAETMFTSGPFDEDPTSGTLGFSNDSQRLSGNTVGNDQLRQRDQDGRIESDGEFTFALHDADDPQSELPVSEGGLPFVGYGDTGEFEVETPAQLKEREDELLTQASLQSDPSTEEEGAASTSGGDLPPLPAGTVDGAPVVWAGDVDENTPENAIIVVIPKRRINGQIVGGSDGLPEGWERKISFDALAMADSHAWKAIDDWRKDKLKDGSVSGKEIVERTLGRTRTLGEWQRLADRFDASRKSLKKLRHQIDASALAENFLGAVEQTLQFMKGLFQGFFVDGLAETVKGLAQLAMMAPELVGKGGNSVWNTIQDSYAYFTSSDIYEYYERSPVARDRDILFGKVLDVGHKYGPFVKAVFNDLVNLVFKGKEFVPSEETVIVLRHATELVGDISEFIGAELNQMSDEQKANLMGRITGMVLFEVVATYGTGGLALAAKAKYATRLANLRLPGLKQETVKKVLETIRVYADSLAKKASKTFSRTSRWIKCFSRDTLVSTESGLRPIGEVQAGDRVNAYDFEGGQWRLQQVKERLDNTYQGPVITIETGESRIEATAYHPFWVSEGRDLSERSVPRELSPNEDQGKSLAGRWVNSHELRAGDVLVGRDGNPLRITGIQQRYEEAFPVSNLTIVEDHNYAVGQDSILVHNTTICDDAILEAQDRLKNGESIDDIRAAFRAAGHSDDEIADAVKKINDPDWVPAPKVIGDIPWSSPAVRTAARKLREGATEIRVANRSQAEELFLRLFQGDGYKNTTGWPRNIYKQHGKAGTYHWDDVFEEGSSVLRGHYDDGNLHNYVPHLQIHTLDKRVIRILFDN